MVENSSDIVNHDDSNNIVNYTRTEIPDEVKESLIWSRTVVYP